MVARIVSATNVIVWTAENVGGVKVNRESVVNFEDLELNPGAVLDLIVQGLPEDAESEFYFDGVEGGLTVNGVKYIGAGRGAIVGYGNIEFWGG